MSFRATPKLTTDPREALAAIKQEKKRDRVPNKEVGPLNDAELTSEPRGNK